MFWTNEDFYKKVEEELVKEWSKESLEKDEFIIKLIDNYNKLQKENDNLQDILIRVINKLINFEPFERLSNESDEDYRNRYIQEKLNIISEV